MTTFVHDDGGRAAAGFKGHTGDCVARAVSIASGRPYAEIYDRINALAANERRVHRLLKGDPLVKKLRRPSSARLGVYKPTTRALEAFRPRSSAARSSGAATSSSRSSAAERTCRPA